MPKIYSRLTIDFTQPVKTTITAIQNDQNSRYIDVDLKDKGNPVDLTNATVKIFVKRPPTKTPCPKLPTDTFIYNIGQITDAENGRVQFVLTTDFLKEPGRLECEISVEKIVKDQNEVLTTPIFNILVSETLKNNKLIESTNEYGALVLMYENIVEASRFLTDVIEKIGIPGEISHENSIDTLFEGLEKIITFIKSGITGGGDFSDIINKINDTEQNLKSAITNTGNDVLLGVKQLLKIIDDNSKSNITTYSSQKIEELINNIDISEQLDNLATKEEVSKKLNIENYNTDKNTFATKTELDIKANKEVVENLSNSTLTKQEFNNQKDNFQLKNDNTLATNNKTIVGAINELKQSIGTGQGVDLSNYYNKTETNNLLSEKVNKTDDGLQTTNKTIVGAINELKQNSVTIINDSSPNGSKVYSSRKTQNELDLKVSKTDYDTQVDALQPKNAPTLETTSKDIVLAINEVNALAKKGGSGDNPITITKTEGINVIDEELATYYTSTGDWSGGGQSASKNKLSSQVLTTVAAVFSINTSKLKSKNSGLIINTKMTNLSAPKPNDSRSVSASLTIGGYQGQQTITRHIGLGSCSGNLNVDYSNNDKFYYVSLPELEMDSYVYAYLNVFCFRSVGAKVTVSCKAVENFDYNFLISNSNCSSSYFFKAGGGNGDLFIKNSITPVKFPDKVNSCIGIGNNILESVGTKDESTYCSSIVGVGNYILQELEKGSSDCIYGNYLLQQAKDINYGTVIGSNISEDKTSAYPNYKYIKKLDYPLSIGYGNKLTDESSNEITIGNNVLGNGSNTITLGDGQITKIYCQANTITQSCDLRLKDNIEKVNVKEVIDALMKINVIRASYRNLEEFKGSNENDKHKLMWDAENMSNIPLFAKDVKTNDRIVTPLDDNGNYIKETIKIIEKQPIQKLEEDNLTEYVDVEVEKEIPRKEVIEDCKEFTPNQVLQALVVGFQEQQRDILIKNEKIINLESKVSQLESMIKSMGENKWQKHIIG